MFQVHHMQTNPSSNFILQNTSENWTKTTTDQLNSNHCTSWLAHLKMHKKNPRRVLKKERQRLIIQIIKVKEFSLENRIQMLAKNSCKSEIFLFLVYLLNSQSWVVKVIKHRALFNPSHTGPSDKRKEKRNVWFKVGKKIRFSTHCAKFSSLAEHV